MRIGVCRERAVKGLGGALLAGLLTAGCARYHPQPISPSQSLEDFEARRLDAPELGAFLAERDSQQAWPPDAWNLHTLSLAAFYYSPELDKARAQWAVARGGVLTAGGRPNPTATVGAGYNVTTDAGQVRPWIPEATLDLPLEIAGRRGIRVAEARHRSEAARLKLLSAAWGVRSRVRQAFVGLYLAARTDSLLAHQREIRTETLRILEARRAAGEASPTEVTRARVALAEGRVAALDASQAAIRARAELADAVGVPPAALEGVDLDFSGLERVDQALPAKEARRRALLHRADVLASLADYEASQKALELEVRKQYPDVSLGPGYQLDQTDSKWTLLMSVSLPVLNRNRGPIAEAEARRQEAAAGFLALQSRVLGQVESATAAARNAVAQLQAADTLLGAQERQEAMARARYRVGEVSRLDLLGLEAEAAATSLARLDALQRAQGAVGALEDAMQTPLEMERWVLESPRPGGGRR